MSPETIHSYLEKRNRHIQIACEYSEPGYSMEGKKHILFGDWNQVPKRAIDTLEATCHLEWDDEWTTCCDCGGAIRTSPDCYSWTQYYWLVDGCDIICGDCVQADVSEYMEYLVNNHTTIDVFNIDWSTHGFKPYNGRYGNGLHPGIDVDPEQILADAIADNPEYEFIFTTRRFSQCYCTFNLVMRKAEAD